MYRLIRNTHLALGLFCCLFLLMYGLSAVQMGHTSWFEMRPEITETRITLETGKAASARALAADLRVQQGLRGELTNIANTEDGFRFSLVRPGTIHAVSYNGQTGEVHVRTSTAGFMGMLNRLHHVHGLWHEFRLTNVWAGFLGFVSLALLVLGATGIYLWFKIYQKRKIGFALLAVSLTYSLTLLVLINNA